MKCTNKWIHLTPDINHHINVPIIVFFVFLDVQQVLVLSYKWKLLGSRGIFYWSSNSFSAANSMVFWRALRIVSLRVILGWVRITILTINISLKYKILITVFNINFLNEISQGQTITFIIPSWLFLWWIVTTFAWAFQFMNHYNCSLRFSNWIHVAANAGETPVVWFPEICHWLSGKSTDLIFVVVFVLKPRSCYCLPFREGYHWWFFGVSKTRVMSRTCWMTCVFHIWSCVIYPQNRWISWWNSLFKISLYISYKAHFRFRLHILDVFGKSIPELLVI